MATKEVLELEVKSNISTVSKDAQAIIEAIKGAKDETKDLDKGLEDVGKAAKKSKGGVMALAKGFGSLIKSLGIIGLLAAGFTALKEALERNQKIMNIVNTIMTTVSTTFNQVVDVLVDTYNWVTKSSDRFDGLGKVMSGLMTLALTPLQLAFYGLKLGVQQLVLAWEKSPLGGGDEDKIAKLTVGILDTQLAIEEVALSAVDAGKNIVNNFGDAISEIGSIATRVVDGVKDISIKANYEIAQATTAAQNSAKLAEAQLQGLIEKNDLLAEKQRQIRDDETKTFAERIAANKELGDVLDKQEIEMMKLADARVAAAKLEKDANKENIELQVAYQQTLNDRAGVEAQIAGFRSEQLTNEVSLNKELLESQREIRAEGLSGIELELQDLQDAYDLKIEMARKAGIKTTAITKKFEAAKTKIVEDNEREKLAAISGFASAVNALAGEQKGIAVATALMNTYLGVTEVMKDPTIPSTTMKFLAAGTVLASGLANVKNILKQDTGGGGGGGSSSVSSAQSPAPQMMSGAFELSGGVAPEAMRAYVVTDEMTNSQNQLANIRRRATI